MSFDVEAIRKDFPILATQMRGRPLVYLDTAASAQKPRAVIDAMADFYSHHYANIHRGVYQLSAEATAAYESVRTRVARFICAPDPREVIFVRNATEAINLVARTWGEQEIESGDEIVLTTMEHHANIVPWQMLAERCGAKIRVAAVTDDGGLDLEHLERLLGPRTKLLAFAEVSNALGTINPVRALTALARERGITTLIDGAQAVPHRPVDVEALGCDFYVFSGHKVFGPSGAGVLYGRLPLLEAMPPFLGGGDMIESVAFEGTTFASVPQKFEAGTPDIASIVGFGAAIDYLGAIGMDRIAAYEQTL
ncbi:MAG: aminotransferase class V-fold PLP-dependent enzyme, partial [Proteobacteria bacterium]|nr:aminotransferase class V-fold PLP-dependent enzyme [Pseudomonadota bacterium]